MDEIKALIDALILYAIAGDLAAMHRTRVALESLIEQRIL